MSFIKIAAYQTNQMVEMINVSKADSNGNIVILIDYLLDYYLDDRDKKCVVLCRVCQWMLGLFYITYAQLQLLWSGLASQFLG